VKQFARAQNISLARCSAYGDSLLDRWMLAEVGHAFAVNPTWRLRRIARLRGWQILHWTHCAVRTASEQRVGGEQDGLKKSLKLKREAAR
jgi:phosphoserine phosphatase